MKRAIVLLSGGLDSSTVLAIAAREARRETYALSFAYGQRHAIELRFAGEQAQAFAARAHEVVDLAPLGRLVSSTSALIGASTLEVPDAADRRASHDIPSTYVPARNALFLTYALAWAEVLDASEIWIGVNQVDYSGYPDCRPAFLQAFEQMARLGTRAGVEGRPIELRAPLLDLAKHEIIARGIALGVDFARTSSCYAPDAEGRACGRCESCELRRLGFTRAGAIDPTRYAS